MLTGYFIAQMLLIDISVAIGELVTVNLAQVVIGGVVTLMIGPTIRSYLRTINYGDPANLAVPPSENPTRE